jgi:fatty acid elongase 3
LFVCFLFFLLSFSSLLLFSSPLFWLRAEPAAMPPKSTGASAPTPALSQSTMLGLVVASVAAAWVLVQPYRPGMMRRFSDDGTYPFTTLTTPVVAVVVYLVTIFTLHRVIKERMNVPVWLFVTHNLLLCVLSVLLAVVIVIQVGNVFWQNGFSYLVMFCDPDKKLAEGEWIGWFYIFYLSKIYEFLDTVIIVVKKNPITFLHVYHHCITLVLTWVMLKEEVGVQYIAITMNLMVHVVMYFYYSLTALGHRVWWKKYITMVQITQFVVDIVGNGLGMAVYYYRGGNGTCAGSMLAWWFGQFVLASFLVLFIHLYVTKIQPQARAAAAQRAKQH